MNALATEGSGKHAIVTGAASGIGRATALRLAQGGYQLTLLDRDPDALEIVAGEIGPMARTVAADLTDIETAIEVLDKRIGGLPVDLLVNCAGVGWAADSAETSAATWNTTIAVNLSATFFLCQYVLPGMLERHAGVIVNIASAGALVGLKRRVAYCASKAGVLGITRAIAADHAGQGIRVNAVCPGTVDSPWIGRMVAGDDDPAATRRRMEERQLDGQLGTPEEVAEWIAFISADTGRFMNGASLVIDAGMTAV
jgi:NAD(P)-dependent dehydrogenase (short-subunit alcohol dehydrogenase family)